MTDPVPNPENFDFDDEAAAKWPEMERLLVDADEAHNASILSLGDMDEDQLNYLKTLDYPEPEVTSEPED